MSISNEQINELLSPIVETMDLIIDRSSKPAALCCVRNVVELTVKADRLEGKAARVIEIYTRLCFLTTRNSDYKDADLLDIIRELHDFIVEAML